MQRKSINRGLLLAFGTEVSAAAANYDLLDRCLAALARLTLSGVDAVFQLEEAGDTLGVDVVRDRGAAQRNGAGEDVDQGEAQALEVGPSEASGLSSRSDAGPGQGFVCIDVADAMQQRLIEQGGFDGGAAMAKESGKVGRDDGQGFDTRTNIGLLPNGEPAEAARIDEADLTGIGKGQDGMGMEWQRNVRVRDEEAAGHAEVHQELGCLVHAFSRPGSLKRHHDGLTDAPDTTDGGAGEGLFDLALRALEGLRLSAGPDAMNCLAVDALMDAVGDGFNLW